MHPEYLIGVDLGQANDYTALAVLQSHQRPTGRKGTTLGRDAFGNFRAHRVDQTECAYQVRHLERLPLGTPYPQQVERVGRVLEQVKYQQKDETGWLDALPDPRLVVDQTGVGRPVVDMLKQAGMRHLRAVTITAGDTTTRDGSEYRVPKRELVSVLQVLLQTDRLVIAAALPEAQTLTKELLAFKVTITAKGHDTYGNDWRENPHDDLVLAVALAAWAGERLPRPASTAALARLYH